MENKNATIRDIAEELGVAVSTVHKAIYNKKGISAETRERILAYIEEQKYQLNRAASALKRKPIRVVFFGVTPKGNDRYYYEYIERGVRDGAEELLPFNVQLETRFSPAMNPELQIQLLENILKEEELPDGIVLVSTSEHGLNGVIQQCSDRGIKVVTVTSDAYGSARHATVGEDTDCAGCIAAELIGGLGGMNGGQVILAGGSRDMTNHRRIVGSFIKELARRSPETDVLEINEYRNLDRLYTRILKYLNTFDDVHGIFCNTARETLTCCKAVQDGGFSGKVRLIGTDVFRELIPYFENNTLTASVYQNPIEQGRLAVRTVYRLVMEETGVPEERILAPGVALQSNAKSLLM